MRTTLTLDEDVAALLNKEARRSGAPFREVVNRHLRIGLMTARRKTGKPFVVTPRAMGLPAGLSYDNVEELIEALEGVEHK
ncbi:MAG: DUF2191 domain-containing protein [Candidatus Solibacter usitatus]|nr:DUF2191 domain-containing protein [Candidatus Solibacter usitatus]